MFSAKPYRLRSLSIYRPTRGNIDRNHPKLRGQMLEIIKRLSSRPILFGEMLLASLFGNLLALVSPIFVILVLNRYIAHGVDATLATLAIGTVIAIILEYIFRRVQQKIAKYSHFPKSQANLSGI